MITSLKSGVRAGTEQLPGVRVRREGSLKGDGVELAQSGGVGEGGAPTGPHLAGERRVMLDVRYIYMLRVTLDVRYIYMLRMQRR